jgi:hypothetical protein
MKLGEIRNEPFTTTTTQQKLMNVILIFLIGSLLGILSKFADGTVLGLVGTHIGFWIVIATFIAVRSRSPKAAAVHVFVFLASMLMSYYIYSMILFGFFSTYCFLAWGSIALSSPIGGYFVWYSRGEGWIAALLASLPISILVLDGYSFYYTFKLIQGLDIVFAIVLLFSLNRSRVQQLRIVVLSTVLFILLQRLGILYLLPS